MTRGGRRRGVAAGLAVATLAAAACGGGSGTDESAFSDWYTENERRRQAFLEEGGADEADYQIYTGAQGLAQARSTCRDLEAADGPEDLEDISGRMENSLGGRWFIDAAVEWVCPGEADTIEALIEAGTIDMRALCEEDPEDLSCREPTSLDPLAGD